MLRPCIIFFSYFTHSAILSLCCCISIDDYCYIVSITWILHISSNHSSANGYLLLLLLLSRFSCVRLCNPIDGIPPRLPHPWDSPGKSTGVGCHFLLQCMKVKSESEVTQSCPTLSNPMVCSPPGSATHGIFQARVLKWGAIAFSNGNLVISRDIENNFLISDALLLTEIFIWIKFNIILIL